MKTIIILSALLFLSGYAYCGEEIPIGSDYQQYCEMQGSACETVYNPAQESAALNDVAVMNYCEGRAAGEVFQASVNNNQHGPKILPGRDPAKPTPQPL